MMTSEIHKGLPIDHEAFLMEKYNSYLTTCRYIEIYYPFHEYFYITFVEEGQLKDLIVFGNHMNAAYCFNSLVALDEDLIKEFTKLIFEKFPKLTKVKIDASYRTYDVEKSVMIFKSDNQILELPETVDEYLANLGSKKRKNIKNRMTRLLSDFKEVKFSIKKGDEISENLIEKIIQFNRSRMKTKGKVSGIDNVYKTNILKYARCYGCVGVLELDGKLIGGAIGTLINKDIFMHVIAYDESFSGYNVGEVCTFNMIQYAIENDWKNFHFLWGRNELKRRMMAENHDLFSYFIFRTYSPDYYIAKLKVAIKRREAALKNSSVFEPIKKKILAAKRKQSVES